MKENLILVIIIIIIFLGGILIQNYLESSGQILIKQLENLKQLIEDKKSMNEINTMSENIYENWKETESKWSVIVLHTELDLIDIALIEMKTNIEENDKEQGKVALEKSIFLINHINEKEKFNLKNIF
jgi:hypothetical protein